MRGGGCTICGERCAPAWAGWACRLHIAELAINHVKGGVEAIYDRHRYQREIEAAFALWADYVLAVVEGRETNVVTLQRA